MKDRIMMRRMNVLLFLLLTAAALMVGCSAQFQQYYPLHVSNQWTYKVTDYYDRVTENVERIIKRVGDSYHFNNKEVILYLPGQGMVNKQGVMFLREPIEPGKQWIENQMTFEITGLNKQVTVPAGTFTETLEITWISKFPGDAVIKPGVMPTLDPGPNPRVFIYVVTYAKRVGKIKEEYYVVQPEGAKTREVLAELTAYSIQ